MSTDDPLRQLHPRPDDVRNLDDDALLALYAPRPGTLRVNFVATVDGSSTTDGLSGHLGGAADRRVFGLLRRLCDVVVVGAGTVRDEGYGPMVLSDGDAAWRSAHGYAAQPVFALVSRSARLDPDSRIFSGAPVRPLVLTSGAAPADRRRALEAVADVVECGADTVEPARLRTALADRGLDRVLCEGGPSLLGDLIAGDVVDELCLTLAPQLEGGTGPRIATREGEAVDLRDLRLDLALLAGSTMLTRWSRDR